MKQPKNLKKGGAIGYVAPSFGCSISPYKECFDNALAKFQKMGYRTVLGPNCYKGDGIGISTNPQDCGREFMELYTRDDVDVIMSCGGGELACEVLDYIDFDALKDQPAKWYLGYSDNTNLILPLTTIAHTYGIYGICAPAFGMEPWYDNHKDIMALLSGEKMTFKGYPMYEEESLKTPENPYAFYNLTAKKEISVKNIRDFREDAPIMRGRFLGGCLDCLNILCGTKFDRVAEYVEEYKEDGFVWFLESCDLSMMSVRRVMWQLEHAGWFRYCRGFIIGRPLNPEEVMGVDRFEAVLPTAQRLGIPVLFDADLGHVSPTMPFISGAIGEVYVKDSNLEIHYEL